MKLKFLLPLAILSLCACSSENEKADDSVLGIWKNTAAFDGNQSTTPGTAMDICENNIRLAFGADYFYNESLASEVPCDIVTENTYEWSETGPNAYECRHSGDNTLYFTATIMDGTMTLYRPDLDKTYLLRHTAN
ncbi:hypothetical protein HYN48_07115 [Flavobacterium magnum]|uniref:Lipocalin-like domain-containing protein n=1 Tax=Flavobacterium magnum TaxID=2162713 RepID=A0A2S0RDW8_9FLAO|nr:hypothetical protein [Flavobacterium magnum]AWA29866.1 hypothetical protein HYN48_07115 [Flavobacterium magnum]